MTSGHRDPHRRPPGNATPSPMPRLALPSWAASVTAHAVMLFAFTIGLKSCQQPGVMGHPQAEYREVGLVVKPSAEFVEREPTDKADQQPTSPDQQSTADAALPTVEPFELDDLPPVDLPLPKLGDMTIGPGSGLLDQNPPIGPLREIAGTSRPTPASPPLGNARETSFFGIRDKGTRFVYVLDSSGSMTYHNAIRFAKAELIASLQSLEDTQQFQIIFYNQVPHVMKLRGSNKAELQWARDVNKTLARQYIASIRADLGTDHMPALRKALSFDPDVIFFLTDADEPQLTAGDLREIDRLNNGKARIHCVEFGKGPALTGDSFLKTLARMNGGTHHYRDVTQFEP